MSYYPREIVDCYLEKKHEDLLNVPNAESIYVASVPKDLANNKFYIERGIYYNDNTMSRNKILLQDNLVLKECIKKYNKTGIRKEKIVIDEIEKINIEKKDTGLFRLQNSKKIRPIVGGIEIGHRHDRSGTLGAIILCEGTGSRKYILSNYHVMMSSEDFVQDKLLFQPSLSSHETRYVNYCNIIAKVSYGHFGKYADVALAEIINNTRSARGIINYKKTINGIGAPYLNQEVFLYGASSGFNKGNIRSTNTFVKFRTPWKGNNFYTLKNQILTNNMSRDGDSGSLLIDNENNKAVGLLIGGDGKSFSIYNNFKYIFNQDYENMPNIKFKKFI
ncbi:hypothetical protein [uncultured Kordia sp.]|uniref:hypothetical protein n=1 Tax=uncultured Kordia sp. TaxID=507699 RepID=UPI0026078ACE|nr:hypothetical protein [uncultured Kordia sp.]